MQNINAKDESLIEAANAIVTPILEAGNSVESGNILSSSAEASNAGLAVAPATPALALAQ